MRDGRSTILGERPQARGVTMSRVPGQSMKAGHCTIVEWRTHSSKKKIGGKVIIPADVSPAR
jgi:hypothetical protein